MVSLQSEQMRILDNEHRVKIIGNNSLFVKTLSIAKRVAASSAPILISGESGTGKEVFAKYIHQESLNKNGKLVAINCSAIPENLLESELFGHAKGSFTGADIKKIGLFEEAQSGTLFLDEIGDLSLSLQAKLLRVLQEKKIKRIGENQYRDVNCRVISATHKNLKEEISLNKFREDLFFRLNVIPLCIPALRERGEDIVLLAEFFVKKFMFQYKTQNKILSEASVRNILNNPWRGNVRELENIIHRTIILSTNTLLEIEPCEEIQEFKEQTERSFDSHRFSVQIKNALPLLDDIIHQYIEYAVLKNGGARDKTAKEIGIDRKTLYKKMKNDSFLFH